MMYVHICEVIPSCTCTCGYTCMVFFRKWGKPMFREIEGRRLELNKN